MNSELNLLSEALSTQGEAESGGVKYIYMDESTIYRFENNRMKKVSATMIKKAHKLLETQGSLPNDAKQPKKKAAKGKAKKVVPEPEPESEDEQPETEEEEDEEPAPPPKKARKQPPPLPKQPKTRTPKVDTSANIDLNEYYNNKNRMEFMEMEMTRLNNKVNKLKQYKSIVNKLTNGEYEAPEAQYTQQQYSQEQMYQEQSSRGRKINDSLFDF